MQKFFYLKTFSVLCRDDSLIEDLVLKRWKNNSKQKEQKIKAIEKGDYWITVLHGILEEMFKVHPLHNLNGSTFLKY